MTGHMYRAAIESYAPPALEVIAAGPLEFCRKALTEWVNHYHPDPDFETPLILEAVK